MLSGCIILINAVPQETASNGKIRAGHGGEWNGQARFGLSVKSRKAQNKTCTMMMMAFQWPTQNRFTASS